MKNTLIVVFAVTTLALGAVCFLQWRHVAAQRTELVSARGEAEQLTREITELQASQQLADNQRLEVVDQAAALAEKLQARMRAEANAAKQSATAATSVTDNQKPTNDKAGFGNFLAKMMDDPETKKMIREQQRMMMDQLYSPLVKKLGFTPDEATQFKDLLAENMMKGAEKATSLFGGGASTNRTEMLAALSAEQKGFEEQVRSFLGETRYEQYQDYQQTVGERTQLSQFRQQFTDGETAITDVQSEQLLALMKDEKKSVAAAGQLLPGAGQDPANMEAMLSGEGVEKLMLAQEAVNQRVYERARDVLSENQLGAFGKFQTNQLQMMRMGMNMAKKFMAPEKSESVSPLPNP